MPPATPNKSVCEILHHKRENMENRNKEIENQKTNVLTSITSLFIKKRIKSHNNQQMRHDYHDNKISYVKSIFFHHGLRLLIRHTLGKGLNILKNQQGFFFFLKFYWVIVLPLLGKFFVYQTY